MVDAANELGLAERVARLSLESKVRLLTGASAWSFAAEPEVGLRTIVVSDGPTGVRGEALDDRVPSVSLPSATCLAAAWDPERLRRLGQLIASEARTKNVDVVLGPTINLHRSPRGGRHFEAFSEDPWLTGTLAAAYVEAVQSWGVGATPKHFIANDSETDRMSVDVRVDERTLRELYLAPFERVVDAGAWVVMSSYNLVNGVPASANPLLREPLKGEWGFDGLVISDWGAVSDAAESGASAQDLVMPGPDGPWGDALVAAVRDGRVAESAIDEKVERLLLLAARVGALEGGATVRDVPRENEDAVVELLRETAADGMVLARNNGLLPIKPEPGKRLAVIGQHARHGRAQGGGSATVFPAYEISPLDGLSEVFEEVDFAPGLAPENELTPFNRGELSNPLGGPGLYVRYLDSDGGEVAGESFPSGRLGWLGDPNFAAATRLEMRTVYTPTRTGVYRIAFSALGQVSFRVDGVQLFDDFSGTSESDPVLASLNPPIHGFEVELVAGTPVAIDVDLVPHLPTGFPFARVHLGTEPVFGDPAAERKRAIDVAAAADYAVVVVGTTEAIESEGYDRPTLDLPGGQDELVRDIAAVNPRTIVVVNAGAPVVMPWLDDVAAVLLSWFPGQEFGHALADVVTGRKEPGGRMPTTWPRAAADVPVWSVEPVDGRLVYAEGLHIGYRAWARREGGPDPAIAFGSGLGYTNWDISEPTVEVIGDNGVRVRAAVTNVGSRTGKQVVQVFLLRLDASEIDRPVLWLAGFDVVRANAGERTEIVVDLPSRSFAYWSEASHGWQIEPGRYGVRVGAGVDNLLPAVEVELG